LPLPPADSYSGDPATSKDRVHLLESAIVRWSKQITSVLRTDPDVMLTSGLDPDPLVELEFWIAKAKNLNSIFAQLESDKMKTILGFLAQSENAFGTQFGKLTADVLAARAEANENARYLNTLKPMLKELNTAPADFADVSAVFRPLMHCILQIWKGSKSYNTNNRLVCLIREICNALIRTCQVFVNGEKIFEAIEQNVFHEALQKLQLSLKIVADFKEIFAEYQKKAAAEIGPQAWAVAPKLFFLRLDAFTDRCTDIIEFVRIASDFVKLDRIFIGYTKGAVLTNTLRNIHTEFMNAMADFRAAPYDVMDGM
jgi:dynein heavy chain